MKWLIVGVITACFHNTLKPKDLPPQGKREEQDLSGSLLLNSAEYMLYGSSVVPDECGAIT